MLVIVIAATLLIILGVVLGVVLQDFIKHVWNIVNTLIFHPDKRHRLMNGIKASKSGTIGAIIVSFLCVIGILGCAWISANAENKKNVEILNAINAQMEAINAQMEAINKNTETIQQLIIEIHSRDSTTNITK